MEATESTVDPAGLVEYIAKCLVKNTDDVQVVPVSSPSSLIIELHVHSDDLGAVIGKNGRIARAVRTLLNSISVKKITVVDDPEKTVGKIILEIIDQ